ncbi:hypothetical protein L9F63_008400, partial [Diploptera punctata]
VKLGPLEESIGCSISPTVSFFNRGLGYGRPVEGMLGRFSCWLMHKTLLVISFSRIRSSFTSPYFLTNFSLNLS